MTGSWIARAMTSVALAVLGTCSLGAQEFLVPEGETWTYFRGTEEPPNSWMQPTFDDSSWDAGPSGFAYGGDAGASERTVLSDMQNNYVSVYIRTEFEVADPAALAFVQLGARYDDGFVAYLNGTEIARSDSMSTAGNPPLFDTLSGSHEVNAAPEYFTFTEAQLTLFEAGTNVLAIQAHNTTIGSSDFSIIPTLQFFSSLCPTSVSCRALSRQRVRLGWVSPLRPAPFEEIQIYRDGELIGMPSSPLASTFTDEDVPAGEHTYEVVALVQGQNEPCSGDDVPSCSIVVESEGVQFRRGDSNGDGNVNLTDAVFFLVAQFQGGAAPPCADAADVNDTGDLNLTDAVFLLLHLFQGGPPVAEPGITDCGVDPTDDDALATCVYDAC